MRAALPALVALALAAPEGARAAEVRVQVTGGSVELAVTAAPVAEVLDRLARQTGMKVVYEGAAPRQLVTLVLKDRTPAQAVLAVLEGQGVNFALVTDATGANVRTLLVTGTAASSGGGAIRPAPTPMRPPSATPPGSAPDADSAFQEEDEPVDEPPVFGVPSGVEGETPPAPPEGGAPPGSAATAAPGTNVPPAVQPPRFPVSPFAPQPTFPTAPAATTPAPATPPQQ